MLRNFIGRLFPAHREKKRELSRASSRISLSIARYKNASKQLQTEIDRNHFAKYLIYDKGDHDAENH